MISEKTPDGQPKPPGLYEWQVKHGVNDEDPMYEIGNSHFSLLAMLPKHLTDLAKERETAAKEYQQHLADLDAKHAAILASLAEATNKLDRAVQTFETIMERQDRILAHLRQIEADFGLNVVDKLDYDRIAMPLQNRIEQICDRLPLARLEQQAEHISHSGDKIELAAYKIDTIADAIAAAKDPKRDLYLVMAGGFTSAAMLVYLVYLLSSASHVIVDSARPAPNSIAPAQVAAPPSIAESATH